MGFLIRVFGSLAPSTGGGALEGGVGSDTVGVGVDVVTTSDVILPVNLISVN